MIENNQSVFTEKEFEKVNSELLEIFTNYAMLENSPIVGQITHINQENHPEMKNLITN